MNTLICIFLYAYERYVTFKNYLIEKVVYAFLTVTRKKILNWEFEKEAIQLWNKLVNI